MFINPNLNYYQIIANIWTLTLEYNECLASFSNLRKKNEFIRETRDTIYALDLHEFEKDHIWELMNGYYFEDYFDEEISDEEDNKFID